MSKQCIQVQVTRTFHSYINIKGDRKMVSYPSTHGPNGSAVSSYIKLIISFSSVYAYLSQSFKTNIRGLQLMLSAERRNKLI